MMLAALLWEDGKQILVSPDNVERTFYHSRQSTTQHYCILASRNVHMR